MKTTPAVVAARNNLIAAATEEANGPVHPKALMLEAAANFLGRTTRVTMADAEFAFNEMASAIWDSVDNRYMSAF